MVSSVPRCAVRRMLRLQNEHQVSRNVNKVERVVRDDCRGWCGVQNASMFTFRDTAIFIALRPPVGKDSDCCSTCLHIVPHPVIVARIMSVTSGEIVETGSSCWNRFTYRERCLNSSQAKTKLNTTPYLPRYAKARIYIF